MTNARPGARGGRAARRAHAEQRWQDELTERGALSDYDEVRERVNAEKLECPYCFKPVHPDNFGAHMEMYHPEVPVENEPPKSMIRREDVDALAKVDLDFVRVTEQIRDTALALLRDEPPIEEMLDQKRQAEAIGKYVTSKIRAREAKLEAQNNIAEVRIRYERELGALIQRLQESGELNPQGKNNRTSPNTLLGDVDKALTLSDIGITYNQSSQWKEMSALPEDEFEEHVQTAKENGWELTSAGIRRHAREHITQVRREEAVARVADFDMAGAWRLLHGDMLDVALSQLDADSIDCVIADPPYNREALPLYGRLSEVAAHVLKPGGSLLVMTGQTYLFEVMAELARHMRYHWTLAYLTPGGQSPQIFPRKVNCFWKPVLWFVKGEYSGNWSGDVLKSAVNDNDKRFHEWGQSESGMAEMVERFTQPGQLILDPCCGAGTTGVAALRLKRQFIGIDTDKTALAVSAERLAGCTNRA